MRTIAEQLATMNGAMPTPEPPRPTRRHSRPLLWDDLKPRPLYDGFKPPHEWATLAEGGGYYLLDKSVKYMQESKAVTERELGPLMGLPRSYLRQRIILALSDVLPCDRGMLQAKSRRHGIAWADARSVILTAIRGARVRIVNGVLERGGGATSLATIAQFFPLDAWGLVKHYGCRYSDALAACRQVAPGIVPEWVSHEYQTIAEICRRVGRGHQTVERGLRACYWTVSRITDRGTEYAIELPQIM